MCVERLWEICRLCKVALLSSYTFVLLIMISYITVMIWYMHTSTYTMYLQCSCTCNNIHGQSPVFMPHLLSSIVSVVVIASYTIILLPSTGMSCDTSGWSEIAKLILKLQNFSRKIHQSHHILNPPNFLLCTDHGSWISSKLWMHLNYCEYCQLHKLIKDYTHTQ